MKKTGFLMAVSVFLIFAGCKTAPQITRPVFPVGVEYEVLGRVLLDAPKRSNGYITLYEKAKAEYPDCDDVVNIWVDRVWSGRRYVLSGLAIKYVK